MRHMGTRFTRFILVVPIILGLVFLDTPPAMGANRVEIGMATGRSLLNIPDDQLKRRLLDMKRLGVTWIRVDFSWADIQPHNARNFDFRFHDKVVVAAENLNIKVMATLAYTPKWARNVRCTELAHASEEAQQKCVPRDGKEFARFARETAWHYRLHGVLAWEIWNEPNLTGYWKGVSDDGEIWVNPDAYARLSNMAAEELHKVKRHAIVMTGGFAPVFDPNDPRGMRQGDFLRQMLPHLKKGGVNAVSMHPYTWPAYPRHVADWNAFYHVDKGKPMYNLQAILAEAGRSDLKIWATEYGASTVGAQPTSTDPSIRQGTTARADSVDEETQARMIREGIEDWYLKPNVGPLFVYADSDQYLPTYRNEGGFGMRRRDGTAKPAYLTLQSAFSSTKASVEGVAKR